MKCKSTAKNNFEDMPLTDFWEKHVHIYKSVGAVAICTLLSFASTYMSKMAFLPRYKDKTQGQT